MHLLRQARLGGKPKGTGLNLCIVDRLAAFDGTMTPAAAGTRTSSDVGVLQHRYRSAIEIAIF
jgi:hypothetical protein